MANKNIKESPIKTSMGKSDTLLVEVGGSIRRISLSDIQSSINMGDENMLRQVAWGVPIKQNKADTNWGRVGNISLWEEYKLGCGRYLMDRRGNAAKLNPNNSSEFIEGGAINETNKNTMCRFPRLYYRVTTNPITKISTLWMSQIPIGGYFIEESWIGAYMGSFDSSTNMRSIRDTLVTRERNITQFWDAAQLNGEYFGLVNYEHAQLMVMMCLSEFGSPDIQKAYPNGLGLGMGGSSGAFDKASVKKTGGTNGDGFLSIAATDVSSTSCYTSVLGVENWYNWFWCMLQGIYYGSSANSPSQDGTECFIYKGNTLPSSEELKTHPKGEYRQLTRPTTNGYTQEVLLGDYFDIIASKLGGDSSSYWCDNNYNNTTGQLCLWGGDAGNGSNCGLVSALSTYAFSRSRSDFGSRLAYYGKVNIVEGKDLV